MKPHDRIVATLHSVIQPLGGELRLLGRVSDRLIGNSSRREVFVFVPDLHLVSAKRQKRFGRYGFNHTGTKLLARVLGALATLREIWDVTAEQKLVTVQLGDFFDLWREFPGKGRPEEIPDDAFGDLRDLLYRGLSRGRPCLKATMLLGNHDTKRGIPLPEIPFQLKAFNRGERPFLFTTHGDAFDLIESILPDVIQEVVVHFLGRLTPTNTYSLLDWGKLAAAKNKKMSEMETSVVKELHTLPMARGAPRVTVGKPLPTALVEDVPDPEAADPMFRDFYDAVGRAVAAFPSAERLRMVTVGHTHQARIALHRPAGNGRPMVLMDCGGWIEKCEYPLAEGGMAKDEPNAQLGVIHGNDARVYQLRLGAASG